MVTRLAALALGVALLTSCARSRESQEPEALVLRGFRLVDPGARSVSERELVIERGLVVARATLPRQRVIEGGGRWLIPALWDLKASLWGNNSTQDYKVLTQEVGFTQALGLHLYYGVAHVGVFAMQREWVGRELRRAEALELQAAEPLYPDQALCGGESFACKPVRDVAAAKAALAERKRQGVPFVQIMYLGQQPGPTPSVSREVLHAALATAQALGLPSFVFVDDWTSAEEAAEHGARLIYGLPTGEPSERLIALLRERDIAYAPPLARFLELDRLLGNEQALADPFLTATLAPAVRDSYRSEKGLFEPWRVDLQAGRERRAAALASVARLAKAGVRVVAVSDAGWTAGVFQGYSSQATQSWLEQAGLSGWDRLSAATNWPAQSLGRQVGFAPGHAADYLALDADPLEQASHLKRIAFVLRSGREVDRSRLLPDLTRSSFKP